MVAKRFRLIYMPENLSSVSEFRFNRSKVAWIAGIAALTFIISLIGFAALALKFIPDHQLQALAMENQKLIQEINSAQFRIEVMRREISTLASSDEELRLAADLPLIDQDIRMAGMGGSLPAEGIDPLLDLQINLEQLERQVEIQKESYPEILNKIEENLVVSQHTPAICPVKEIRITSGYGYRRDPFTHERKPHHGIDFGAPRGTPVYAPADGKVVMVKRQYTFGKVIKIDHGYGFETVYGHLNSYNVKVGQTVKRGDLIGAVGNTGRSTGPHLHYEVRVDKKTVNPMDYLFDISMTSIK